METKPTSQNEQRANRRYLTVWRWHFLCRTFGCAVFNPAGCYRVGNAAIRQYYR